MQETKSGLFLAISLWQFVLAALGTQYEPHIKEGQSYLLMASQVPGTVLSALHGHLTIW